MVGTCPDKEVALVSRTSDMDFIILVGQILDEFVEMNRNLNEIRRTLSAIEDQLGDIK